MKFHGPEGAKFAGRELVGVQPSKAKIRDLAAIQVATGWKLPELRHNLQTFEMLGFQGLVFLTLRNAGFFISWDEAGDLTESDVEPIEEPGDRPGTAEEEPDPTSARTASAPGDVDVEPAPASAPRKPKSRGSKSRSSSAK